MTDDQPGDPTPEGRQHDASTDTDDLDPDDVAGAISEYRHTLGQAHAEAMEHLEQKHGVETERELYEALGYTGDLVTIEVQVFDAELHGLLDLLDEVTDIPQPAHDYVTRARLLDGLLDATDPTLVTEWLEADLATGEKADVQPGAGR